MGTYNEIELGWKNGGYFSDMYFLKMSFFYFPIKKNPLLRTLKNVCFLDFNRY